MNATSRFIQERFFDQPFGVLPLLAVFVACLAMLGQSATAQDVGGKKKAVLTDSAKLPPKAGKYKAVEDIKYNSDLKIRIKNKSIGKFSNIESSQGPSGEVKKFDAKLTGKLVNKIKNDKKKPFSLDGKVTKKILGREDPKATGAFKKKMKAKTFKGEVDKFGKLKVRQNPDVASVGDVSVREISNGSFEIIGSLDLLTEASRDGNTFHPAEGGPTLFQLIPIPEPAAGVMFVLGCCGLGAFYNSRRNRPDML
jgi:hypothetical protein